tara:strand:- start:738 stop:1169 length:432 start_codon:yes stop_codon:yes gene_type:complete
MDDKVEIKERLVFVYGTLKHGFHNHVLLENDMFISKGVTHEAYLMTESGIPYVSESIQYSKIQGEIYLVSRESMDMLDMLESHPTWYERKIVTINTDDGIDFDCWLYFNEKSMGTLINQDGDYGKENARRIPIQQKQEGEEAN